MLSAKTGDATQKPLTSVMEDYLKAIFDLDKSKKVVRVKNFTASSGKDLRLIKGAVLPRTIHSVMFHRKKQRFCAVLQQGGFVVLHLSSCVGQKVDSLV